MNPVINKSGDKLWYNELGKLHRIDGPAIEYANGNKDWFIDGQRHRTDGPAIEYIDGTEDWYLYDERYLEVKENKIVHIFGKNFIKSL